MISPFYSGFQDVNDNAPSFAQSTYSITVDQYDAPGSLMGTISPTDADSGVNREFSCSGSSTASSATTYYSIGADCGKFLIWLQNKVNKILNSLGWWLIINKTHNI